jgi:N-carbamoyl-L-amino-acid hydrolase
MRRLPLCVFIGFVGTFSSAVYELPMAQNRDQASDTPAALHVDRDRLQQTLDKLGEFGRGPGGGVTRLGFSEADLAAREYAMGLMRSAGLSVRVDPAGNIFGRRAGSENLPVIMFGSHIDSVPNGGKFDGDVGSMGGIEVMRALRDHGIATRHPLEVVIWENEEGHHFGRDIFGSSAAAGLLDSDVLERRDDQGTTVADWLRRYGQDPARFSEARLPKGSIAAYVELHIEQGRFLDDAKIPIGVVEGIVGIRWLTCVATGFANHAGTTPMDRRQDALSAAARATLAVREEVQSEPGHQVGTVGYLKVEPGARNVIPGRVEFPVELRDLDTAKVERIWDRIEKRFAQIAKEENVALTCTPISSEAPALADPIVQAAIRKAAKSENLASMDLPSGAGHDAQQIARIAPMGMIFVPSRGGISHSPQEFTPPDEIAEGAEVLYRTVLLLDRDFDRK